MDINDFDFWFDKQGNKIKYEEWARLKLQTPGYFRIGLDTVGPYKVSTVWLGHNHRFGGEGPPIIFETMVFLADEWDNGRTEERYIGDIDLVRYCTEEEAKQGHEDMCTLIRATMQDVETQVEETDGQS